MLRYILAIIAILSLTIGYADQQGTASRLFFEVGGGFGHTGTGYQAENDGFKLRNDQGLGVNFGGRMGYGPFNAIDGRPIYFIGDIRWFNGITAEEENRHPWNGNLIAREKFSSNHFFFGLGGKAYPLEHLPNYHASVTFGVVYSHVGIDLRYPDFTVSGSGGSFGWGLNLEAALDAINIGVEGGRGLLLGVQFMLLNAKEVGVDLFDGDITVNTEVSHAQIGVFARYRF